MPPFNLSQSVILFIIFPFQVKPRWSQPFSRIHQAYTLATLPVHQMDVRQTLLTYVDSCTHMSGECLRSTYISGLREVKPTPWHTMFPPILLSSSSQIHNCSNILRLTF